ncbi:hypothetical protein M409DRAFT_27711 [Zasmidium cellare ATCC 36951]|uniref:HAUS augmin-like complex subunit 3 N-terminal domain-containing protein n=1 Tax=Zasmidium cellare ATCC 36951 TaxID=1080233 RepID=A0A6A6C4P5_ZASCE|nr:uncharacterized protein M409DRAFT_27711 [Zasmidium cellare ATCC 36951]KAF2161985.1 hypothetical protein M409DRAFT_27711 [Zasmidium cellare ATCC 36951]
MAPPELDILLRALSERDIPLNGDDVAWAFETAGTRDKATDWVKQHLHSTTLLSKDELNFAENSEADLSIPAAPGGRPLSEAEFEAAIDSIEASTAAIEKQCALFESQRKALRDIQARNASRNGAINAREAREKRLAHERAQLDFETDDVSQTTTGRLRTLSKQSDSATSGIPSSVERIFEKDDRLLDGLQKILPRFSNSLEGDNETADVERLCSTLAALSASEIRARLDKVYHETLTDYGRYQNGSTASDLSESKTKQRATLRAELDELGSEIDGLVAIAVDHQFRKPLKRGMVSAQVDSQAQKAKWAEYTVAALAYLTSRLDAIGDHIYRLHSHSAALQAVSNTLEETVAAPSPKSGGPQRQSSPATERSGGRGLKLLRLVQANFSEGQDPTLPFLREHDVRIGDADSVAKISGMLEATVRDQEHKLASLGKSTESNITETLSGSFARTDADLQSVLNAVYAKSEGSTVQLVDGVLRADMEKLEHDTQRLGDGMRGLDVDDIARVIKGKQRQLMQMLGTERE